MLQGGSWSKQRFMSASCFQDPPDGSPVSEKAGELKKQQEE